MKTKYILAISLFIGGILSIFASGFPDGLEKVAKDQSFIGQTVNFWPGLLSNYSMPSIRQEWLATALAGICGTLIVFGILKLIEIIISKRKYES